MSVLKSIAKNFLDFLPLFIFLQVVSLSGKTGAEKWLFAYEVAGAVSVVHVIYLRLRKIVASRVALGVDLYLFTGGMVSVFSFTPIIDILNAAREFGVLLSICIVGISTTIFSPSGFVGYQSCTSSTRRYSAYLLMITFVAAAMSYLTRGNPFFAGVIPVLAVVIANKIFLSKLKKCSS